MEWAVTELAPGHGVQQVSRRYHQFAGRDNVGRHLAMHAASNVGVYHINRREAVGILGSPCAVRQRVDHHKTTEIHQAVLTTYPNHDIATVVDWMLLAAINALIAGDQSGANYHLAWAIAAISTRRSR